jgi:hypothetical protein
MLRCGWADAPVTDAKLVNRWYEHWQRSGAWNRAEAILTGAGHLAALLA